MDEIAKSLAQNYYAQDLAIVGAFIAIIALVRTIILKGLRYYRESLYVGFRQRKRLYRIDKYRLALKSSKNIDYLLSGIVYKSIGILLLIIYMFVLGVFIYFVLDVLVFYPTNASKVPLLIIIAVLASGELYYFLRFYSEVRFINTVCWAVLRKYERRPHTRKSDPSGNWQESLGSLDRQPRAP